MSPSDELRSAIAAALAKDPGAIVEYLAEANGATPAQIAACLPPEQATGVSAKHFEAIMEDMRSWGRITFIVHTPEIIFEAKGEIPKGECKHGMFNLHGDIGGHIRVDNCAMIYFASRPFMGLDTCSVQFYGKSGNCMFKIYLGRDKRRNLIPEQVEKFRALRDKLSAS